jgi:hypothetical protein
MISDARPVAVATGYEDQQSILRDADNPSSRPGIRRGKRLCDSLDQETHTFRLGLCGGIDDLQPRIAGREVLSYPRSRLFLDGNDFW